ncbi:TRAP transporter substrate-binding protein [Oceanobacillus jeddahense]|uniref:TRAP transporter substrate-binding protein n=1 Tax=Oceanobacillus jeddahense TaxID=1462527 RepID=UPI0005961B35|nr:TRAP transporter substrate-binding protein [Oceanobacillus jeddahense]
MRRLLRSLGFLTVLVIFSLLAACIELTEPTIADESGPSNESNSDSEVTLRLGHVFAEDDPIHKSTVMIADLAKEYSDGELQIDVYSNSQLGGERELVEGVQMGMVDIGLAANAPVTNFIPSLVYWDFPYLVDSIEHMERIENDESIMGALQTDFENNNLVNLGIQYGGFRQITNSVRPIETLDDFSGINIRLLESEVMIETFENIPGTRTSNMAFSELYSGLQQGVVNAQENPLNSIYSMKFFEVQDYLSLTNHFFTTRYYLMNADRFDLLSEKQQEALVRATEEVMELHKEELFAEEAQLLEILEEEGMEINEVSDEFVDEFRTQMKETVYPRFYDVVGNGDEEAGQKLIEEIEALR